MHLVTYKCFSSCGINCPCISGPGEIGGRCYGVNALPDLLAQGYRELP